MTVAIRDRIIDDETYLLLEEWYGKKIDLSTALHKIDTDGLIGLLDEIIEDSEDFGEREMATRAKVAKRKLA